QRSRTLLRKLRPIAGNDAVRGLADLLEGEIELRDGVPAVGLQNLLDATERLAGTHLPLAVSALMRAGEASIASGNFERFAASARRVRDLARGAEPPLLQLTSDHFEGLSLAFTGQHREAKEPLTRVVKLAWDMPGC